MSVVGALLGIVAVIFAGVAILTFLRFLGWLLKWIFVGGIVLVGLAALFLPFAIVVAVIALIVGIIVAIVRAVRKRKAQREGDYDSEDYRSRDEYETRAELAEFYGDDYDYGVYDGDPYGTPGVTDDENYPSSGRIQQRLSDF